MNDASNSAIRAALIKALDELRVNEGPPDQKPIIGRTKPIEDLGLTSEDGVELACILEDELGISIDDRINPLVHDSGRRGRTFDEVAKILADTVQGSADE